MIAFPGFTCRGIAELEVGKVVECLVFEILWQLVDSFFLFVLELLLEVLGVEVNSWGQPLQACDLSLPEKIGFDVS